MLSQRLVYLRKENRKTQQEMADLLGVTRPAYTAYERGSRKPDYDTLQKIADHFDVTTDYLLGRSNTPNSQSKKTNDSIEEINRLLDKYEIDDMAFFDIEKWKSMSPQQIKELESYFQYLVQKSKELNKGNN